MNRRNFALALGLGGAAFVAPRVALAEDHLAEAISHTKEAINDGKQGHADVLVTHAEFRPHACRGRSKGRLQSARRARRLASEGSDCGRKESERPRRDSTCFGGAHSPGSGEGEEIEQVSIRNGKTPRRYIHGRGVSVPAKREIKTGELRKPNPSQLTPQFLGREPRADLSPPPRPWPGIARKTSRARGACRLGIACERPS